jgi:SAM-dependent methyltransferase
MTNAMSSLIEPRPWQLEMFSRSLKKPLKLEALLKMLGNVAEKTCLLVTCGDNNGALNWHFRQHGGDWNWADVSGENIDQISALLAEPVHHLHPNNFPFENNQFDCLVAIDVLEHLPEDGPFLREVKRVLRPGGMALITVPNGDPRLLANRIKLRLGMIPAVYGHTRAGYSLEELRQAISQAGLEPLENGGYSRFFTEMVELAINFGYVRMLSRKREDVKEGQIAPASSQELKTHGLAYRLYSVLFPLLRLFSKLDALLPNSTNNAVIISATCWEEELS